MARNLPSMPLRKYTFIEFGKAGGGRAEPPLVGGRLTGNLFAPATLPTTTELYINARHVLSDYIRQWMCEIFGVLEMSTRQYMGW